VLGRPSTNNTLPQTTFRSSRETASDAPARRPAYPRAEPALCRNSRRQSVVRLMHRRSADAPRKQQCMHQATHRPWKPTLPLGQSAWVCESLGADLNAGACGEGLLGPALATQRRGGVGRAAWASAPACDSMGIRTRQERRVGLQRGKPSLRHLLDLCKRRF